MIAHNRLSDRVLKSISRTPSISSIIILFAGCLRRIKHVTHLPRLSPARVTRIKGRFFYCALGWQGTPMSGLPPAPLPLLPYSKPWLSYQDQVALLQSRGMVVHDVQAATEFLRHVNYYRFSGYCLVFEAVRHTFNPGVTFEQVHAAYEFDTILRDIVTEALEAVEVNLRTAVAHRFGEQYGAFGHTNAAHFYHRFHHPNWRDALERETRRSTELYVSHFRATYTGFPSLPVWVVPNSCRSVCSHGCSREC